MSEQPPRTNKQIIQEELGEVREAQQSLQERQRALNARPAPDDNSTRQQIARIFVYIYFCLLGLILVGIPLYNLAVFRVTGSIELTIKLTDLIQTYSAVVGPTLGFVVAYYFKSKND
jgi:hypothetical protein